MLMDKLIEYYYSGDFDLAEKHINEYPYIKLGYCPFRWACIDGHLELAKWILYLKPSIINIDLYSDDNYESNYDNVYDSDYCSDYDSDYDSDYNYNSKKNKCEKIFEIVCSEGYLDVAQWLLTIKPTITDSRFLDYAFEGACKHNHLNVAKWIQSLVNPYRYIISCNKAGNIKQYRVLTLSEQLYEKNKCEERMQRMQKILNYKNN